MKTVKFKDVEPRQEFWFEGKSFIKKGFYDGNAYEFSTGKYKQFADETRVQVLV